MKYVNYIRNLRSSVLFCIAAIWLTSCGTNTKDDAANAQVTVEPTVVSTEQYLPVDSFDKEGVKLPYVAAINPYAAQTGRLDKDSVATYIEARRAFKSGNYKKSKSILESLVEKDKKLSGPWVMLGDIAYQEKEFEDAIKQYEAAIEVNPENVNAYLKLARVLREKGEFIPAQNAYAKVLGLWKDFPEAHLNLAVLYDLYLNEPLKAQQHMEAFQFLSDRENAQVAEWLAEIRTRTGVSYSIKAGAPEESPSLSVAGEIE